MDSNTDTVGSLKIKERKLDLEIGRCELELIL